MQVAMFPAESDLTTEYLFVLRGQCLERVKRRKREEPLTVEHDRAQLTPIEYTAWKFNIPCLQPRSKGSVCLLAPLFEDGEHERRTGK
jgi:hypothetical protein